VSQGLDRFFVTNYDLAWSTTNWPVSMLQKRGLFSDWATVNLRSSHSQLEPIMAAIWAQIFLVAGLVPVGYPGIHRWDKIYTTPGVNTSNTGSLCCRGCQLEGDRKFRERIMHSGSLRPGPRPLRWRTLWAGFIQYANISAGWTRGQLINTPVSKQMAQWLSPGLATVKI